MLRAHSVTAEEMQGISIFLVSPAAPAAATLTSKSEHCAVEHGFQQRGESAAAAAALTHNCNQRLRRHAVKLCAICVQQLTSDVMIPFKDRATEVGAG